MIHLLKKLLSSVAVALTIDCTLLSARAKKYLTECVKLLCPTGGWPALAPCARARAEIIRRMTPWQVERPLQIWRCPFGLSFEAAPAASSEDRIFSVPNARQFAPNRDYECERSANVVFGTYGAQGDFAWQRSSSSNLPPAFVGLEN